MISSILVEKSGDVVLRDLVGGGATIHSKKGDFVAD